MPGWDGRFSRKTATSEPPTCVISHSAARFPAMEVVFNVAAAVAYLRLK